jgi:hypothetical protein
MNPRVLFEHHIQYASMRQIKHAVTGQEPLSYSERRFFLNHLCKTFKSMHVAGLNIVRAIYVIQQVDRKHNNLLMKADGNKSLTTA